MTPTLILTRPIAQSESFAAEIMARWTGPLNVIISPLLRISPVAASLPDLDAVVFTSVHGVKAAQDLGLPPGTQAWCVGPTTAQAAQTAGFVAKTGPGDADGLVAQILDTPPSGRIAHIRGRHARGDISARLMAAGINCADIVAYDQQPCNLSAQARALLDGDKPVVVPLFSPRSCTILQEQGPFTAPLYAVAISEAVQNVIGPDLGWEVTVANTPDGQAMQNATIATLEALFR